MMNESFLSFGNRKLPKSTAIFNFTSATDCPSKEMCYVADKCYALKAERYPAILNYRRRQAILWDSLTVDDIVKKFLSLTEKRKKYKTKLLRFSEGGDFKSQSDVDKADAIAGLLLARGIKCYTYTARKDLDYSKLKYLIVNGSNFMAEGLSNKFIVVKKFSNSPDFKKCIGDCTSCSLCINNKGLTIEIEQH